MQDQMISSFVTIALLFFLLLWALLIDFLIHLRKRAEQTHELHQHERRKTTLYRGVVKM